MPCYCDTPASDDQYEIERRSKERMYSHAMSILTKEQVKQCQNLNLKQFSFEDINENLCKICKVLTKEQMERISAFYYLIEWPHENLYEWHIKHCEDDKRHNSHETT